MLGATPHAEYLCSALVSRSSPNVARCTVPPAVIEVDPDIAWSGLCE
jgi:hypothetical protein